MNLFSMSARCAGCCVGGCIFALIDTFVGFAGQILRVGGFLELLYVWFGAEIRRRESDTLNTASLFPAVESFCSEELLLRSLPKESFSISTRNGCMDKVPS